MGGIRGVIGGPIRGASRGPRNRCTSAPGGRPELHRAIARRGVRGPKSASARPGPCTRPRSADALARREYHPARQTPASSSFVLGRRRRPAGTARRRPGGCGRSTLTPGRAGRSRGHGSGVPPSAPRHPPGEGAPAPAESSSAFQHDDITSPPSAGRRTPQALPSRSPPTSPGRPPASGSPGSAAGLSSRGDWSATARCSRPATNSSRNRSGPRVCTTALVTNSLATSTARSTRPSSSPHSRASGSAGSSAACSRHCQQVA